jgi:signal transduction histidine kinase
VQPLFDITAGSTLAAILASLTLGSLVYFRATNMPIRFPFAVASLALILWSFANFASLKIAPQLLWARVVLLLAIALLFSFYILVRVLTSGKKVVFFEWPVLGLGLLSVITAAATQTPFVFKGLAVRNGEAAPEPGPLIVLFGFTVIALFVAGGIELLRAIGRTRGIERVRILYVAFGYLTMFAFLILTQFVFTNVFQTTFYVQFGPLFTLIFLGSIAYAIFRHQLLNIRVIATEFILATIFAVLLVRGTLREIRALQELSDAKTEFINIASHQLRTPLTALKGYLSMMKEGTFGTLQEKQEKTVDKLYATNEAMIRLVNDLLNVSRADQGRLQYIFKELDLRELISGIVDRLRVSAESKGLSLSWDPPKEAVPVIADDDKLAQVISNFIDNSIKYTEHGGITVRISMEESVGGHVMVRVSDTGIGIPKEEVAKLFQRFSRGSGGQRVSSSGAGLGLYIAKTIAEGHHGRVWAESEGAGKGSTFVIELPLANSPEAWELVSGKKEEE